MNDNHPSVTTRKLMINTKQKYLSFRIKKERYAIKILDVKEIIAKMSFTEVPKMPAYMKGVINLRGNIIPVIDVRNKLEMEELEYHTRTPIIICIINEDLIGFIVDETSDVLNIQPEQMTEVPKYGTAIDTRFIENMAKIGEEVLMIININKLFSEEEIEQIIKK